MTEGRRIDLLSTPGLDGADEEGELTGPVELRS